MNKNIIIIAGAAIVAFLAVLLITRLSNPALEAQLAEAVRQVNAVGPPAPKAIESNIGTKFRANSIRVRFRNFVNVPQHKTGKRSSPGGRPGR